MRSIYAFVRNSLREDVKPIKFVLCMYHDTAVSNAYNLLTLVNIDQPPRRELKVSDPAIKEQSLAQLQLAPNSVLLLSFLDDSLNGLITCLLCDRFLG
jgi:tether containing UBX domain for GLUT4